MIELYLYLANFQPLLGRATVLEMVRDGRHLRRALMAYCAGAPADRALFLDRVAIEKWLA